MTRVPVILITDCSASDTELAEMLLRRTYPEADIRLANDAVAFADALASVAPNVAIVTPKLGWAASDQIIGVLRRRSPRTGIILFGHESDLLEFTMTPGPAVDGVARKSSAGYMALADIVTTVLERGFAEEDASQRGLAIDDLPVPAFTLAADGTLTQVNALMERYMDVPRARLQASPIEKHLADGSSMEQWRSLLAGADSAPVTLRLRGAMGTGTALIVRRQRSNGSGERYLGCVMPVNVQGGSASLPGAGSELGNQEMRDIALVFSHDLKEPVQQIARIAQRVDDASEAGGPRATSLQQILDCANRASSLLDRLLEYLAVSARDSPPSLVDLNQSLEQALDNLRGVIDESGAQIASDRLPAIVGDEYQMLHLMQNLISNAIKFRGRDRPEIRISVEANGNEWVLAFRDNGIGIAQAFLNRVFEMGQRLHTRDEYPGTGVGLALCKRIVERHGGRIWVSANDGVGCTFFVRLPRAPSQVSRLA